MSQSIFTLTPGVNKGVKKKSVLYKYFPAVKKMLLFSFGLSW